MRIHGKLAWWMWLLVVCLAPSAARAQADAFGTQDKASARAIFEVSWDPSFSEIEHVVDGAVRRLNQPGDPWSGKIRMGSWRVSNGGSQFDLAATGADRAAGMEAIRSFTTWLGGEVKAQHERTVKEREMGVLGARKEMEQAANAVREVDAELAAFRGKLRNVTKRVDVSREGIAAAATGLEQEAQKIAIELRAIEARKQAMEKVIAMITMRAKEEAKQDPVLAELEGLVAARERELKQAEAMHQRGVVSMADFENIRTKVAEAKIRLMERRETTSRGGGADTVKGLSDSLLMMSIDIAEQQARLEAVRETLARFEEATELLDRMDQILAVHRERSETVNERRARVREAERKLGQFRQPAFNLRGLEERPDAR